jgi:choice-of-anchor A domain-containing protein
MGGTARAALMPLGAATGYGEFVLGDSTRSGVDAQGKVAVGGNASFNSFSVASQQAAGAGVNLVVGGNLAANSASVTGSAVVGGHAQYNNPTVLGNFASNGAMILGSSGSIQGDVRYGTSLTKPAAVTVTGSTTGPVATPLPIDFAAAATSLQALSQAQFAATDPYVTKVFGGLNFTSGASGLSVFNITASEFSGANNYAVTSTAAPGSDVTFVINVLGTSGLDNVFFRFAGNSLTGLGANRVLYNFLDVESLTVEGIGVDGTILAPWASVQFNNGNIDGGLIARTLAGNGESHVYTNGGTSGPSTLFNGTLRNPPVPQVIPEPSSLALAGIGGLGLIAAARRTRRRRAS